jgi:hypothetical protein
MLLPLGVFANLCCTAQETSLRSILMNRTAANTNRLSLRNEIAARRLGWTPESQITWREFLDQYPYMAREIAVTTKLEDAA